MEAEIQIRRSVQVTVKMMLSAFFPNAGALHLLSKLRSASHWQIESFPSGNKVRHEARQRLFVLNHILDFRSHSILSFPACLIPHHLLLPFNPPKQSAEVQYVTNLNRIGTLSSIMYQLVSKRGPRVTACKLRRSTSSMMIHS
jgi:hypothetical protein